MLITTVMGVHELNFLFKAIGVAEYYAKHHDIMIVDGSNLLYQTLTSQISQFKKKKIWMDIFDAIDMPLIMQLYTIITGAIDTMSRFVERHLNEGVNHIYIVMDPSGTPIFDITIDDVYNKEYAKYIDVNNVLSTGETLNLQTKAAEQESRKARTSKERIIKEHLDEIEGLKESGNLTDEQLNILKNIFYQAFFFCEDHNLLKLSDYILMSINAKYKDVTIIRGLNEADFVIKNLASEHSDKQIVIASTDTDYLILFSDMPNVDVLSIGSEKMLWNPYKCWRTFLGERYSYETVIRIAALLGNDYTVHDKLISAKSNSNDILSLFNINNKFNSLKQQTRKKLYELICDQPTPDGYLTNEMLDDMICKWSTAYFTKYFISNVVCMNWNKYGNYTVEPIPSEEDLENELKRITNIIVNKLGYTFVQTNTVPEDIASPIEGGSIQDVKHCVFYKWKSSDICSNWERFYETLERTEYHSDDDIVVQYYEYQYAQEDIDSVASEFL